MEKILMKYRNSYKKENSWGLLPIVPNSPIVAGVYDPNEKVLALICSTKKEHFKMVNKLDAYGSPMAFNGEEVMEREKVEGYFEHYLSHPDDIKYLLKNFTANNFEFLDKEDEPKGSLILQQTEI